MNHSNELNEIAAALALAQGEMAGGVAKDSKNPQLGSRYAGLTEVLGTALPILSKHGLSIVQGCNIGVLLENAHVNTLMTRLYHSSGQWIDCGALIMPELQPNRGTNDAQMLGSAITYCRRYMAMAAVGLAPTDDDANAAGAAHSNSGASAGGPGGPPQGSRTQQARNASRPPAKPEATGDVPADTGAWTLKQASARVSASGSARALAELCTSWKGQVPDTQQAAVSALVKARIRSLGASMDEFHNEMALSAPSAE